MRYEHYANKRLRKLQDTLLIVLGKLYILNNIQIRNNMRKQEEMQQAERDYLRSREGAPEVRVNSAFSPIPNIFNKSLYIAKVDEMANSASPEKKTNAKIAFYNKRKNEMGSSLGTAPRSGSKVNLASTPGQFFHSRHQRNNSSF